jgi:ElaB/YqjD/DUF883 family membrane-anchored ribosome-binding protein
MPDNKDGKSHLTYLPHKMRVARLECRKGYAMAQEPKKDEDLKARPEALQEDIERLKEDVSRLTDTLDKLLNDGASTARETLRSKARQAKSSARRARAVAEDEMDEAMGYARSTIADRPVGSVAAALGIGVLLGLLLRRH